MTDWHPDIPEEYRNQIVTGDARVLCERIPDESVDLIFTDPPYPKEYLPLYGWLAKEAARVLKPGALCVVLCGHFEVLTIANLMRQHLDYFWIGGMGHSGSNAPIFPRKMWATWKPCLWFCKQGNITKDWTFDLYTPKVQDKRFHNWGQPTDHASYYIARLSTLGSVLLEPFTGGGTVPAVCKMLGRNYIAFEIDPDTAERARVRVEQTQPPLFVMQEEQGALWGA